MESKFVEIRDHGTCVPALAIKITGDDDWCARRAGFGDTPCIYLVQLATEQACYDPYHWNNPRTMGTAHGWLVAHFDELENSQVLDVRVILGERAEPVVSDRVRER